MFNRFKKKQIETSIYSPVAGALKELSAASDPIFKEKIMGDGFLVEPNSSEITSPISGKILTIFPTKHAFTLESDEGVNILIHIGADTVQLEGIPFDVRVKEGERVEINDLLVEVDFDYIKKSGKMTEVYVIFPELVETRSLELLKLGEVAINEKVATV